MDSKAPSTTALIHQFQPLPAGYWQMAAKRYHRHLPAVPCRRLHPHRFPIYAVTHR
ncbi:hypothetical protein HanIR_Chr13g0648891 [Helianthus annuus]|nr:hypothetical protein HanIR_Chr13g0648891 [Helianthus annuus]